MFMFEDIVSLDDRAVQLVLRQVETADLATALKGVADDVRDKVIGNLSERARENLARGDRPARPGPAARWSRRRRPKIVQVIRSLEDSGQIEIQRGGEDDEFVA